MQAPDRALLLGSSFCFPHYIYAHEEVEARLVFSLFVVLPPVHTVLADKLLDFPNHFFTYALEFHISIPERTETDMDRAISTWVLIRAAFALDALTSASAEAIAKCSSVFSMIAKSSRSPTV